VDRNAHNPASVLEVILTYYQHFPTQNYYS